MDKNVVKQLKIKTAAPGMPPARAKTPALPRLGRQPGPCGGPSLPNPPDSGGSRNPPQGRRPAVAFRPSRR